MDDGQWTMDNSGRAPLDKELYVVHCMSSISNEYILYSLVWMIREESDIVSLRSV